LPVIALSLLDLRFRLENIRLSGQCGGIDFGNLTFSRQERGLLLGAIKSEKHFTLLDGLTEFEVNLSHAARYLGHYRDGAIVQRRRRGRGLPL
jgi:hypothetical protein